MENSHELDQWAPNEAVLRAGLEALLLQQLTLDGAAGRRCLLESHQA